MKKKKNFLNQKIFRQNSDEADGLLILNDNHTTLNLDSSRPDVPHCTKRETKRERDGARERMREIWGE